MKFGLRLMAFWVFSLVVGGGYASVGGIDALNEVAYLSAER